MHRLSPMFFTTMPISRLVTPDTDGYFYRLSDRWWAITDTNEVLFYGSARSPYQSPQCNLNRDIAEKVGNSQLVKDQGIVITRMQLIAVAFQPIRIADYQ